MTRMQKVYVSFFAAQIPLGIAYAMAVESMAAGNPGVRAAYLMFPVLQALASLLLPKDESDPFKCQAWAVAIFTALLLFAIAVVAANPVPSGQGGVSPLVGGLVLYSVMNGIIAVMLGVSSPGPTAATAPASPSAPAAGGAPKGAGITREDADGLKQKMADLFQQRDAELEENEKAKKPDAVKKDEAKKIRERFDEQTAQLIAGL